MIIVKQSEIMNVSEQIRGNEGSATIEDQDPHVRDIRRSKNVSGLPVQLGLQGLVNGSDNLQRKLVSSNKLLK